MRVAFIGGGKMGEAIIRFLFDKKICQPSDISVNDVSESRLQYLKSEYGVTVMTRNIESINGREVVVLAVKPQNINQVLDELKGHLKVGQLVVSIAAGVKINTIQERTMHRNIVRAMPNTPAQIGLGIRGWTATKEGSGGQKQWAKLILGAMGKEIYFDKEDYLDMVTAISGRGPAYLYLFAELLIDGAVDLGLARKDAENLVKQTMLGAAQLMNMSNKTPAEMRRDVTSTGGTTERAITLFEKTDLAGIITEAVKAAYQRAKELGEVERK